MCFYRWLVCSIARIAPRGPFWTPVQAEWPNTNEARPQTKGEAGPSSAKGRVVINSKHERWYLATLYRCLRYLYLYYWYLFSPLATSSQHSAQPLSIRCGPFSERRPASSFEKRSISVSSNHHLRFSPFWPRWWWWSWSLPLISLAQAQLEGPEIGPAQLC